MTVKKDAQRPLRNLGIGRLVSRGVTEEASLLLRNLGNARPPVTPAVRRQLAKPEWDHKVPRTQRLMHALNNHKHDKAPRMRRTLYA